MKRIRVKSDSGEEFPKDVTRIVAAFAAADLEVTREQAVMLWERYSSYSAASWLFLPDVDEEIVSELRSYFEVLDEVSDE